MDNHSKHILDFTKYFDVKSPKGVFQNSDLKKYPYLNNDPIFDQNILDWSMGVDLYMPRPTIDFAFAIFNAYIQKTDVATAKLRYWSVSDINHVEEYDYSYTDETNKNTKRKIKTIEGPIEFQIYSNRREVINYNFVNNVYTLLDNFQIPLGLAFIITEGYGLYTDSKSGNFKKGYTFVPGKIDENYTYGVTGQLLLIDNLPVLIKPDEKLCQLIMKKVEHIVLLQELTFHEFQEKQEVKNKRNIRVGGFGSTDTKSNDVNSTDTKA
jgi:dUTPase